MTDTPANEGDVLVFLKYDMCEAAEKCEPCKGVRQMAIAEIERLRKELAEMRASRDRLADLAMARGERR